MMHKHAYEALNRTLQDICGNKCPFGDKVVVMGGDFRQVLPVIPNGSPAEILNASLNSSYLWQNFKKFNLNKNMRVESMLANGQDPKLVQEFCEFLLEIGEGRYPTVTDPVDNSTDNIQIPEDIAINTDEHGLIAVVYPNIAKTMDNISDRAILATTNKTCDIYNQIITSICPGKQKLIISKTFFCVL
jgi:ATP-dependent DNA helicase PIF1